jgi:hypothetical protein
MRTPSVFAGAVLAFALCAPLPAQQTPVVSPDEIDAALASRARSVDADRSAILRLLSRADVRAVAESRGVGLRLDDARAAVTRLDGEPLSRLGGYARSVEAQLAGGQTITMTTGTLIVILLLVIIVILVAD